MDDGLQVLFDYTVFHIGIYITLAAAIVAAEVFWNKSTWVQPLAVLCLLVAGAAGGAVASNIPAAASSDTLSAFLKEYPTLFMDKTLTLFTHGWLTQIEHGFFWLAMTLLLGRFFYWRCLSSNANSVPAKELSVAADSVRRLLDQYGTRITSLNQRIDEQVSETQKISAIEERLNKVERQPPAA